MIGRPAADGPALTINRGCIFYLLAAMLCYHSSAATEVAHVTSEEPPTIEKTFDAGTLVEHTIITRKGSYEAALRLSQRRQAEGSPTIVSSHLRLQLDSAIGQESMTLPMFEQLLTDLMTALNTHLGDDLPIGHLGAGGFMNIKAVAVKNILAFSGYAPWERYLANPDGFTQLDIHTIVRNRWTEAGVFAAVEHAFTAQGYTATFSGFEKLFVIPAGTCSFYPELQDFGIHEADRFPYPGSISFTLKRIHRQQTSGKTHP
jgi:hypothetical protein